MKVSVQTFNGMIPRVNPRALPNEAATLAVNARLLSMNLEGWRDMVQTDTVLGKSSDGTITSLFPMAIDGDFNGPYWLHWTEEETADYAEKVTAIRGPIIDDVDQRTYFVGTDRPRVTDINRATNKDMDPGPPGNQKYPYDSRILGVPAPTVAPDLDIVVTTNLGREITLVNPSAETGTTIGWEEYIGSAGTTFTLEAYDENDNPGVAPAIGEYYFGYTIDGGPSPSVFKQWAQDVPLADVGIAPGTVFTVTYKTRADNNGIYDELPRVTAIFFDAADNELGSAALSVESPPVTGEWLDKSLDFQTPVGTDYLKLTMDFGGPSDRLIGTSYLDDIHLYQKDTDYYNDGSTLDGWETNNLGTSFRTVDIVEDDSVPPKDIIRFTADESVPWMHREFSLSSSNFTIKCRRRIVHERNSMYISIGADANGMSDGFAFNHRGVFKTSYNDWDSTGSGSIWLGDYNSGIIGVWIDITINGVLNQNGTVTASILVNTSQFNEVRLSARDIPLVMFGNGLAFKHYSNEGGPTAQSYLADISVTAQPVDPELVPANNTRAYVYTYVSSEGEESAPSPVSGIITLAPGNEVLVFTPADSQAPFDVVAKRIYRTASGSTTQFLFVAEIPLSETEYHDTKTDAELGEILETTEWDLPPEDAHWIVTMPNGITVMLSKNTICPSVINRPHAYPQGYRLATDYKTIAAGVVDNQLIVTTQANPYLVVGDDPSTLQMAKLEHAPGNVSGKSLQTMAGVGVIYASPDGMVGVAGAGTQLLTEGLLSKREWEALNPSSIHGFVHDARYYGFYDNGVEQAGFVFDPREPKNTWTKLDFYPTVVYSNPYDDQLYMVIEGDLYIWDKSGIIRPYLWESKLWQLPRPANFRYSQVRTDGSGPLTLRLYDDGVLYFTKSVTNSREFTLPAREVANFSFSLAGSAVVSTVEFAEDSEELA